MHLWLSIYLRNTVKFHFCMLWSHCMASRKMPISIAPSLLVPTADADIEQCITHTVPAMKVTSRQTTAEMAMVTAVDRLLSGTGIRSKER